MTTALGFRRLDITGHRELQPLVVLLDRSSQLVDQFVVHPADSYRNMS